jgi:hypothetical protein
VRTFKSWQGYSQFERAIKYHTRYIHTAEVEIFCQTILQTAEPRVESFSKDSILWRAQLGNGWRLENEEVGEVPAPHEPERMCPRRGRAIEGRANPKGIPCLYMASNRETALAEVRPWVGSYVSVGQFKTVRKLKVVNCTTERKGFKFYFKEPSPKKREEAVWSDIDRALSQPVTHTDDVADYVPTQVLSELFKSKGFDGIGYRSSLGDGYNIALFDTNSTEIINCSLCEVDKIKLDSSEVNSYYLQKHYRKKKQKDT